MLDCDGCGGQFVEHALLRDLLEHREKLGRLALHETPRQKLALQEVRYFACPECDQLMNRKNFGGTSGIVVDACTKHGIWFDAAELAGVLAFVSGGGAPTLQGRSMAAEFKPTAGVAQIATFAISREKKDGAKAHPAPGEVIMLGKSR